MSTNPPAPQPVGQPPQEGGTVDTARVFEQVFEMYKSQAGLLLPAALIVFVPVAIINGIILTSSANIVLLLATTAVALVGTFWFQGMVVEAVRDMQDGKRDFTLGTLVSTASAHIGPLMGAGLLAGLCIAIGLLLLVVPGLILLTIWALIVPVIVIERVGVGASFSRSRELVRGNGWKVFGVIVVMFVIQAIVTNVLQRIAISASDSFVGYSVASLIGQVLIAPLWALAASVIYFQIRGVQIGPAAAAAAPQFGAPAQQYPPPQ
jgi:hypothetical protein